jgi:mono/diheme cytochrome c family protein
MVLKFQLLFGVAWLFASCSSTPPVNADGSPDADRLYNIHCSACHKPDGSGGIAGAKNLITTGLNKTQIEQVIKNGQGDMMPFSSILSPEEIAEVADFVHDFKY